MKSDTIEISFRMEFERQQQHGSIKTRNQECHMNMPGIEDKNRKKKRRGRNIKCRSYRCVLIGIINIIVAWKRKLKFSLLWENFPLVVFSSIKLIDVFVPFVVLDVVAAAVVAIITIPLEISTASFYHSLWLCLPMTVAWLHQLQRCLNWSWVAVKCYWTSNECNNFISFCNWCFRHLSSVQWCFVAVPMTSAA